MLLSKIFDMDWDNEEAVLLALSNADPSERYEIRNDISPRLKGDRAFML